MAEGDNSNVVAHIGGPQSLRSPVRLSAEHDIRAFQSDRLELNEWLIRHAARSEAKTARTYVVTHGAFRVVGYYTLATGSIKRGQLPSAKFRQNAPDPIPIIVLGRLATDERFARQGIGRGMLRQAIRRMLVASDELGVRGLVAHAIDERAGGFYLKFGFVPCLPIGTRTFLLPTETARAALD